jgi:hypothetical protein
MALCAGASPSGTPARWTRCLSARVRRALFAGWINRQQQAVIDYLLEEDRVLRAARGPQRLRLTDDQRRRLPVKGQVLGRCRLAVFAAISTPLVLISTK